MPAITSLIKHLLKNNFDAILAKSLLNCHVKGLHSIMLLESPGKTIRLYVADKDHELHLNRWPFDEKMTLAFHPHHCNLTLHMVEGIMLHSIITPGNGIDSFTLDAYEYTSHINNGKGGFKRIRQGKRFEFEYQDIYADSTIYLRASDIHSIYVHHNCTAAWLVYEGAEDSDYRPLAYSNANLEAWSDEGLYEKPSKDDIGRLLKQSGLLS